MMDLSTTMVTELTLVLMWPLHLADTTSKSFTATLQSMARPSLSLLAPTSTSVPMDVATMANVETTNVSVTLATRALTALSKSDLVPATATAMEHASTARASASQVTLAHLATCSSRSVPTIVRSMASAWAPGVCANQATREWTVQTTWPLALTHVLAMVNVSMALAFATQDTKGQTVPSREHSVRRGAQAMATACCVVCAHVSVDGLVLTVPKSPTL